jgi:hypothetical protein
MAMPLFEVVGDSDEQPLWRGINVRIRALVVPVSLLPRSPVTIAIPWRHVDGGMPMCGLVKRNYAVVQVFLTP